MCPLEAFTRSSITTLASEQTAQESSIKWIDLDDPLKGKQRFTANRNSDNALWLFEVPISLDGSTKDAEWNEITEDKFIAVGVSKSTIPGVSTTSGDSLPTLSTPGTFYIYNPTDGKGARLFIKFGNDWTGMLMPSDLGAT